jgi:Co/Zn/Cd efflux system component
MGKCGDGCGAKVDKVTPAYVRVLWVVVAMNAAMFVLGLIITATSGSVAVRADLLDFLGDALATGLGLLLVGRPQQLRSRVSFWQGVSLGMLGLYALGSALMPVAGGMPPESFSMGIYGILGLIVNIGAALLLLRHRKGDASVRAVWLYSRNDALGNVAVLGAAVLVALSGTRWPDVGVGFLIALFFLHSAYEIIVASRRELRVMKAR